MGQAADTYLKRHPYAYTSFEMAPGPIVYTNLDVGTHVCIFSHTFLKQQHFQNFFGPFQWAPRASRPDLPNSLLAPPIQGFFAASTSKLTKGFTQALPTSNVTPTPTPRSDPTPRDTYRRIFSRLCTSILTLVFIQALPPPTSPLHQCNIPIPLLALRTLRSFIAAIPRF